MYPELFRIGTFPVRSFGAVMVVAFLLSAWFAQRRAPRYGITSSQMSDFAFFAILAGILGARVLFIVQELDYFLKHPDKLFSLQFEGLTSFGGLIFGSLAAILWARKKKIPLIALLDAAAPAFLVGHIIGRFGCLLNGCCFGGVCPPSVPWGIHVEGNEFLHHPAQVYDSAMNLIGLGLILLIERARSLRPGAVTGLVIALHGVARFIYEFWRAGTDAQVREGLASSTYWGSLPITQAQGMALGLVLIGAAIAFFAGRAQPSSRQTDDSGTQLA